MFKSTLDQLVLAFGRPSRAKFESVSARNAFLAMASLGQDVLNKAKLSTSAGTYGLDDKVSNEDVRVIKEVWSYMKKHPDKKPVPIVNKTKKAGVVSESSSSDAGHVIPEASEANNSLMKKRLGGGGVKPKSILKSSDDPLSRRIVDGVLEKQASTGKPRVTSFTDQRDEDERSVQSDSEEDESTTFERRMRSGGHKESLFDMVQPSKGGENSVASKASSSVRVKDSPQSTDGEVSEEEGEIGDPVDSEHHDQMLEAHENITGRTDLKLEYLKQKTKELRELSERISEEQRRRDDSGGEEAEMAASVDSDSVITEDQRGDHGSLDQSDDGDLIDKPEFDDTVGVGAETVRVISDPSTSSSGDSMLSEIMLSFVSMIPVDKANFFKQINDKMVDEYTLLCVKPDYVHLVRKKAEEVGLSKYFKMTGRLYWLPTSVVKKLEIKIEEYDGLTAVYGSFELEGKPAWACYVDVAPYPLTLKDFCFYKIVAGHWTIKESDADQQHVCAVTLSGFMQNSWFVPARMGRMIANSNVSCVVLPDAQEYWTWANLCWYSICSEPYDNPIVEDEQKNKWLWFSKLVKQITLINAVSLVYAHELPTGPFAHWIYDDDVTFGDSPFTNRELPFKVMLGTGPVREGWQDTDLIHDLSDKVEVIKFQILTSSLISVLTLVCLSREYQFDEDGDRLPDFGTTGVVEEFAAPIKRNADHFEVASVWVGGLKETSGVWKHLAWARAQMYHQCQVLGASEDARGAVPEVIVDEESNGKAHVNAVTPGSVNIKDIGVDDSLVSSAKASGAHDVFRLIVTRFRSKSPVIADRLPVYLRGMFMSPATVPVDTIYNYYLANIEVDGFVGPVLGFYAPNIAQVNNGFSYTWGTTGVTLPVYVKPYVVAPGSNQRLVATQQSTNLIADVLESLIIGEDNGIGEEAGVPYLITPTGCYSAEAIVKAQAILGAHKDAERDLSHIADNAAVEAKKVLEDLEADRATHAMELSSQLDVVKKAEERIAHLENQLAVSRRELLEVKDGHQTELARGMSQVGDAGAKITGLEAKLNEAHVLNDVLGAKLISCEAREGEILLTQKRAYELVADVLNGLDTMRRSDTVTFGGLVKGVMSSLNYITALVEETEACEVEFKRASSLLSEAEGLQRFNINGVPERLSVKINFYLQKLVMDLIFYQNHDIQDLSPVLSDMGKLWICNRRISK